MASHSHHSCHQHHQQQAHHHQSTCCCSCSSPQQPQLSPADPLLQAIATQLLQQQQHHLFTQYAQPHHQNHHTKPTHYPLHHHEQEKPQSQALYTSLLRRITALESSLHHLSSFSLKDHAARTIQTHFRAYLVRRSQTLRNLKHLAIIKTTFNSLKSSISDKPHFNPDLLSQKAMDLLHRLDFIQGGDPMIRDGKRSMSRELVQILEFIEGVSMKRRQLCAKTRKNVRFAEDAERSRVHKNPHKQLIGEDDGSLDDQGVSSDDQTEVLENLRKKIENIEGFSRVYEEDEDESQIGSEAPSSEVSNGEGNPKMNLKSKGYNSHLRGQNGNSMFCPPLPVQMESTRDDQKMKTEKIVRVVR